MVALLATEPLTTSHRQELGRELRRIELRLEDGYRKIEAAVERGEDVRRWEDVWIRLLHDYERIYEELNG